MLGHTETQSLVLGHTQTHTGTLRTFEQVISEDWEIRWYSNSNESLFTPRCLGGQTILKISKFCSLRELRLIEGQEKFASEHRNYISHELKKYTLSIFSDETFNV